MIFTDKEKIIHQWIVEVSKNRPEIGGFPVCPYAFKSKNKIIECKVDDIVPGDGYDVIIFIIQDDLSVNQVQEYVKKYNEMYKDFSFFEDCASQNTFINGVKTNNPKFNLILSQPNKKLEKYREILSKTDYYTYWSKEYYDKILNN
jgi:hypothetical protein